MKKIPSFLFLSALLVCAIYLGAFFHARIFSLGDGLSRANLREDTMPASFEISPKQAVFIHGSILGNALHWGTSDVSDAYVDNQAYYILGVHDLPQNQPYCSYTARMFGTCINGKDGTILNKATGEWEKRGYIHLTKNKIIELIQEGMDLSEVYDLLGKPFPECRTYVDEGGKPVDAYHYWCIDGEVVIFTKESKVNHIAFGTPGLII